MFLVSKKKGGERGGGDTKEAKNNKQDRQNYSGFSSTQ